MNRVKTRTVFYHEGDTFNHLRVRYLDELEDPVDLTGFTPKMVISTSIGGAAVVTLALGDGIDVDSPATGVIQLNAPPAKMSPLVPGTTYFYDLQISDGATTIETLLRGRFLVDGQVTT